MSMRPGKAKGPSTNLGGSGGGGGNVSGTLTPSVLPVATAAHTLGDSMVSQAAEVLTFGLGTTLGAILQLNGYTTSGPVIAAPNKTRISVVNTSHAAWIEINYGDGGSGLQAKIPLTNDSGGLSGNIGLVNASRTLLGKDSALYFDTSAGGFNFILPPVSQQRGRIFLLKISKGINSITLIPDAGNPDTIDGLSTYTLTGLNASVILHADPGSLQWVTFGAKNFPGESPAWIKFTIPYTSFQGGSLTFQATVYNLPPGGNVHAVKAKCSQAFTGVSSCLLTLEGANNNIKYLENFDLLAAVSDTNLGYAVTSDSENNGAFTLITGTVTCNANTSNLSQGVLEIGLLLSICTLP